MGQPAPLQMLGPGHFVSLSLLNHRRHTRASHHTTSMCRSTPQNTRAHRAPYHLTESLSHTEQSSPCPASSVGQGPPYTNSHVLCDQHKQSINRPKVLGLCVSVRQPQTLFCHQHLLSRVSPQKSIVNQPPPFGSAQPAAAPHTAPQPKQQLTSPIGSPATLPATPPAPAAAAQPSNCTARHSCRCCRHWHHCCHCCRRHCCCQHLPPAAAAA